MIRRTPASATDVWLEYLHVLRSSRSDLLHTRCPPHIGPRGVGVQDSHPPTCQRNTSDKTDNKHLRQSKNAIDPYNNLLALRHSMLLLSFAASSVIMVSSLSRFSRRLASKVTTGKTRLMMMSFICSFRNKNDCSCTLQGNYQVLAQHTSK